MLSVGQLLAFGVAALIIILIPGPSVMFVVGRALAYGRRKAVLTAIGNAVGAFAAAALVAVGLGAIVQQSALAFGIVKYAGAAYLIFLGVKAFRDRKGALEVPDAAEDEPKRTAWTVFEGFLVGVLNPKTILFFLAILPQFVNPDAGSVMVQMLVLGAVFAAIAVVCDTGWSLVASAARNLLRSPRSKRVLGGVGGTSMIGLGIAAAAGERA
ncbi:LysE family translocator [Glycomyces tenuis]|uniref:LysE family translocator n=1 Tax=Glycomyces tenuis TaxID=58116 RepID=UPI00040FB01E|nr:LysE family translocator [Glycomyces tenuis]